MHDNSIEIIIAISASIKGSKMKLKFSNWVKWDERAEELHMKVRGKGVLDGKTLLKFRGIYALSMSSKDISGNPFKLERIIVYFGMTNSKAGIAGRLKQFDNTLRKKKGGGHGGAARFCRRGDGVKVREKIAKKLFVSVCPFFCSGAGKKPATPSDWKTMGLVAKAEYDAFAMYVNKYGALPKYNDKDRSPKM